MIATKDMCPHCKRTWYKKIGVRTNGADRQYYTCECLICHQKFDMEQWWYNKYDKKMKRLGSSDKDVAELLIKKGKCIYCGHQVEKRNSPQIEITTNNTRRVVSEIFQCIDPECEKLFYVPKSMYDDIKKIL